MTEKAILTSPLKNMIPIIKIVGDFCNLRCGYCFYNARDQSIPRIMSDELLEKFISQYMELFDGAIFFIWHGGEPLLAGLSFFQKIIDLQTKYRREGQTVKNAIQTNATLITNDWAEFFKIHNFKVGASLDGGEMSHNRFRTNCEGGGSFERVMRGIEILKKHDIQVNFIQTLTHDNANRAKEDFDFFANILGAKGWGVNTYFDLENANKTAASQTVTNKVLTEYLKIYIDLWLEQDDSKIVIREIDNTIAGIFKKRARSCAFNGSCTGYFCLEYDGKIYPCDRLSNRPEFLFGDLSRQPLLGILNGSARLKYAENTNSLHSDCAACEWKNACHNGCTANRVGGIEGKYYYCETRKAVFAYLKEKIKERMQSMTL